MRSGERRPRLTEAQLLAAGYARHVDAFGVVHYSRPDAAGVSSPISPARRDHESYGGRTRRKRPPSAPLGPPLAPPRPAGEDRDEKWEQKDLFEWKRYWEQFYPELEMMYAMPLGGWRAYKTAVEMKLTGSVAGVLDILLDVPRPRPAGDPGPDGSGWFHGARVELKRLHGGSLEPEQKVWIERFRRRGFAVYVCHGYGRAAADVASYLGLPGEVVTW